MAQSLSKILIHIVFSTKYRKPSIPDEVAAELHAYLAGACRAQGCEAYCVGGVEDHVHIACSLSRTLTVSKLVEEIKRTSSRWLKARSPRCADFAWQGGYGVFSLGHSQLPTLIRYIKNQRRHHHNLSFKNELLALFKRYHTEYDEHFLWD